MLQKSGTLLMTFFKGFLKIDLLGTGLSLMPNYVYNYVYLFWDPTCLCTLTFVIMLFSLIFLDYFLDIYYLMDQVLSYHLIVGCFFTLLAADFFI